MGSVHDLVKKKISPVVPDFSDDVYLRHPRSSVDQYPRSTLNWQLIEILIDT